MSRRGVYIQVTGLTWWSIWCRKRKDGETAARAAEAPAAKRQTVAVSGDVRRLLQLEKER